MPHLVTGSAYTLYAYEESNGTTHECSKPYRNTHHRVYQPQKIFAHDASFDGGTQQLVHSAEKPVGAMSVTPEGEHIVNVESTKMSFISTVST
jgi:hypothetical protein